jgi:hypothetical protein
MSQPVAVSSHLSGLIAAGHRRSAVPADSPRPASSHRFHRVPCPNPWPPHRAETTPRGDGGYHRFAVCLEGAVLGRVGHNSVRSAQRRWRQGRAGRWPCSRCRRSHGHPHSTPLTRGTPIGSRSTWNARNGRSGTHRGTRSPPGVDHAHLSCGHAVAILLGTASSSDHRRRRYIMKRVRIPPGRGLTIPTRTSNRVTTPAKIAMCLKRYRSKHCAQADSNRQRMDSKSYFSAFVASSCDGIRKNCKSARCATSSFTQSSQPTADCPTVRSVGGRTTRRCEPARGFSVISGR